MSKATVRGRQHAHPVRILDRVSIGNNADVWAVIGLVLAAVVVPLVVAAASGSLEVSHNDDFNYRRVALGLYRTGDVELTNWTVMSLIGQVAFVQPFLWASGGAAWAFGLSTAVLSVPGVAASYLLARRFLSVPGAVAATSSVVFFPGFLLNTTSFMTDVPAYSGQIVCLWLGALALDRHGRSRWALLAVALAVGCFAFSIREFALAAPVAVVIAGVAAERGFPRAYATAAVAVLATCGVIYVVTTNLPGQGSASISILSTTNVDHVRQAVATLALVISPALVIFAARNWRRWRLPEVSVAAVVGLAVYRAEILQPFTTDRFPRLLVGNLLEQAGAPGSGVMAGNRAVLFPAPTWEILNAAAGISAIVGFAILGGVLGWHIRRAWPPDLARVRQRLGSTTGLLVIFVVLYAVGLAAFGLVASMFDRYLWPLALPLSVLLLMRPETARVPAFLPAPDPVALAVRDPVSPGEERRGMGPAWAVSIAGLLMAGLGLTSVALMLNSDAFDSARWRMGEAAVQRGFAANTVDAGMEWVGYHASGMANIGRSTAQVQMWYAGYWPSFKLCAMVASSPIRWAGSRLETTEIAAYRLLLFAGPQEPLYLYSFKGPACA